MSCLGLKIKMQNLKVILFCFLAYSPFSYSAEVWGVLGATTPLSPVLGENQNTPSGMTHPIKTSFTEQVLKQLPIKPIGLINGEFQKYQTNKSKAVTQPLCFVGSDQRSLNWLAKFRAELLKAQALCFVVDADQKADLLEIKRAAKNLHLQFVNGVQTARGFGVTHYPSVVYQGWINQ